MLLVPSSVWALAGGWWLGVIMNGCLIGLSPAIFIDRGHDHNHSPGHPIDISTNKVWSSLSLDNLFTWVFSFSKYFFDIISIMLSLRSCHVKQTSEQFLSNPRILLPAKS